MSTRSDIIVHCADGKWRRIYCHWDGYLANNGRILFDHYTSQSQVDALVALGDLSSLGPTIGKKHDFEYGMKLKYGSPEHNRLKNMCTAYGRDRGEKNTEATVGDSLHEVWPEANTWTEFTYVWDEGRWWVGDPDKGTQTLVDLGDALTGKSDVTPAVKIFGGGVIGKHKPHDPTKLGTAGHSWTMHKGKDK